MKPLERTVKLADVIRAINVLIEDQAKYAARLEMTEGMMLDLNQTIVEILKMSGMEAEEVKLDS